MSVFAFLSYFKPWWKTTDTDYETILARLTSDITDVQQRLTQVRTRERRASVTLTLYAFLAWAAYAVACWWFHPMATDPRGMILAVWLPVLSIPVFIIYTRRIVRWWYRRIAVGEEKHLRSLQRTRASKIDEIKRATKFDSLRLLLERYDESAPPRKAGPNGIEAKGRNGSTEMENRRKGLAANSPNRSSMPDASALARSSPLASTPAGRKEGAAGLKPLTPSGPAGAAATPKSPAAGTIVANAAQHPQLAPKTWLDRVADKVLGQDPNEAAAEQRYALICRDCMAHNGLCPKDEFEEIQYVCPKCGTFNSRRPSTAPVSSPWTARPRHDSTNSLKVTTTPTSSSYVRGHTRPNSVAGILSPTLSSFTPDSRPASRASQVEAVEELDDGSPPSSPLRIDQDDAAHGDETPSRTAALRARRTTAGRNSERMDVD